MDWNDSKEGLWASNKLNKLTKVNSELFQSPGKASTFLNILTTWVPVTKWGVFSKSKLNPKTKLTKYWAQDELIQLRSSVDKES